MLWVALCSGAVAQQAVPQLGVEIVYGRPKPRVAEVGYSAPEVFDPFTDRLYQGGYRYDGPPTEIPQEARYLTAMGRTKKLNRIFACADAWYYPFAHTAPKAEPPGIEIEILSIIAKRHGFEYSILWANTGVYRAGLGGAFAKTIDRGNCDVFLGLIQTGGDNHMSAHDMAFTRPYLGVGFVLIGNEKVKRVRSMADLKGLGVKVGVPAYSPMHDAAKDLGLPTETYFQNNRVIDGFLRKEVDAALVWGPSIPVANREKNVDLDMVPGWVPAKETRWNAAWGIKKKEDSFLEFFNKEIGDMLASGEIQKIVEKYGVPWYAPFPDAPTN